MTLPPSPPLPPTKESSAIPPPPPPSSTTKESNARRQLVEEYRRLMDFATLFLLVSLGFVCITWYLSVFCNFLASIAWCVLCSLYVIGYACFVYLLATGREDIAQEWSRNAIVEFIFRTSEANALFNRYQKAAASKQPPSYSSDSSAKEELADKYRYLGNDAISLLIGSLLLLFIPAFPLLSGKRSGLVLVASFIAAVVLTVFCLFLTIGRYVFVYLLKVGREDIVREWSQKTFFLFSTDRARAIFQRISIEQQQDKARLYHQV